MDNIKILVKALNLSFQKRRLAVRLWAINLLFAIFAVAPFFFIMTQHMSHSFAADRALQRLDIFWLGDFITRYMNVAPAVTGAALLALALYLLLTVFLNGGVIGGLNRPEGRTTLADFFHDCGLYFWRFLRLALLSIPVYLVILAIGLPLLRALLSLLNRRATTEWPAMIASNLRFLAIVLLLGIVAMFFDYVKIALVRAGRSQVLRETWQTLKFIGRRFFRAWGLYLLAGLVFVTLTLLYLEIARILPKARAHWVGLFFLWQQFYILCRQWSKVLFFATGLKFMEK
ncbi:MAG TPA: hypothetical protein VLQ89_08605, partial [Candidatus Binatia bacterium]|nr:hypothetical protein [Candidatus Binatia bacterium]